MKTVVDTNVLISGIFFDGPPARILQAWLHGQLEFVVSNEILEEYFEVCERLSHRYPKIEDDDKFIACALASDTKTIISGDRDLLAVSGYENIQIVTPRAFVDRHLR